MPAILVGKNLPAQTHAPQSTKPAQQQKAAARPPTYQPAPEAIAAQPPASPAPISPADQPPNQARVSWDSRGLEIEASNSSLNQILHQVAADTGAKLEGLTQDQRVFGSYGPGPGSDVLLKLLDGSGYNVLMIGGRDTDAPLEIVLSARSPASPQTAANNQNRSNSEQLEPEPANPNYSPEPPRPQPIQNPFGNGEPAARPAASSCRRSCSVSRRSTSSNSSRTSRIIRSSDNNPVSNAHDDGQDGTARRNWLSGIPEYWR